MAPLTRTNTTVLLVCEGYAEVEWVRVIRDLYLPRGCGISLRPENRRGYGGAAALTLAVQRRREGEYDRVGVVVDTDQHWGDAQRQTVHSALRRPDFPAFIFPIFGSARL